MMNIFPLWSIYWSVLVTKALSPLQMKRSQENVACLPSLLFLLKRSSFWNHSELFSYFSSTIKQPDGEGNGNPLQYSCLENLMDREAW